MSLTVKLLRRYRLERIAALAQAETERARVIQLEKELETAHRNLVSGINERNRLWVILTKHNLAHLR